MTRSEELFQGGEIEEGKFLVIDDSSKQFIE